MIEVEAAASAVNSAESRTLVDVDVVWEKVQTNNGSPTTLRGHFSIPFHFAKKHSLKFRGLIRSAGESASGWLCIRAESPSKTTWWSRHAHVIGASIPGHGG